MGLLDIEDIETIPIRLELPYLYRGSHYRMPNRCTIITRIRTSGGIVGETYNADSDTEQAQIIRIVQEELKPLVVGRDAMAVEQCWDAMKAITLDQLRDRRLAMQAVACVDSAIWDAIGKAVELPLYKLWGGFRSKVPMIGIGGYYGEDPHIIEREVGFFAEMGTVGMKFKVGGLSPEEDAERLRRAAAEAPSDFFFLADANQAWTVSEALQFIRLTEDITPLRWFEEPCRWPNDHLQLRDVRLIGGVPVAAGQSEITAVGMRDLMSCGSIDVSNFDASWGGGPTEWRRVAALASVFDVEMAHHEEAQVASHLLASVPHGTYVEAFTRERDPIFWQMVSNRPNLADGQFPLPEGLGLGWELDAAFVAKYRAD